MSYILEALRKADAERDRERGALPDLHAQPVPPDSAAMAAASPPRSRPWLWIVVGASVGLIGPLLWLLFGRDTPQEAAAPPPPAETAAPAVATAPVSPVPPAAPVPAPPPPTAAPAALAVPVPAPPPRAEAPAFAIAPPAPPAPVLRDAPASTRRAVPAPAPLADPSKPVAEVRKPASAVQAPAPTAAPTEKPAAPAAAEGRVHTLAELPDDIRRQLPAIAVGGSIYSAEAANRFLIINGQIFHEKDKLGPELVLEQIKLKAAVLRFKGYRYEITY
ncbi:general secretion pathway protein GspB [Methylibium sp.]|jgi:general secretion pathway protein B|uniref:general secretion pathway protein GspB n=1 Tax=Methylibium sp. TaxID=2067992 RepID=UPI003D0AE202